MPESRSRLRLVLIVAAIMFSVTLVIALIVLGALSEDAPTLVTSFGKIIGHYKTSYEGNKYEAYEGIPYALPPLGDRRFEPPVPWTESWPSGFMANKLGERCVEYDLEVYDPNAPAVRGSEDCLKLNVYVPKKRGNQLLPVLFWIHDGAFQYGAALPEAPHYLMDQNVIYVSIGYRLGTLGFLSTEDTTVSGNMGLKDQVVALKWVNENIGYFGGNPKRITIVGLSAGGASVHYHYLSPMSRGLFHSGISMSGTALMPWAQTENSRAKAFELGRYMGCPTNTSSDLVRCLKKKPAHSIVKAQKNFMPWRVNPFTPFGPMVEMFSNDPFISKPPMEIIKNGEINDAPWVTGVVSEEGLYPIAAYYNDKAMKEINDHWMHIAPFLLDYNYTIHDEYKQEVADKIWRNYLGDKPVTRKNFKEFTEMVGDRIFNVDAEKAAIAQAQVSRSPVLFYFYSYRASESLGTYPSQSTDDLGVCHGDDAYLILGNDFMSPKNSKKDLAMMKDLINMWTSVAYNKITEFASNWQKVGPSKTEFNYLHIGGPENFTSRVAKNFARRDFWNSLGFNENL